MGNLYHCTLTFSCRLSPPSSRSLQSVLDFFYSLEGLGTFGTSHLPGGVENSNLPGGGSHYPSSIWGVQLTEVGTSHISWGVQLHANGSSHSPGRVQLPVVGTSNPPWGSILRVMFCTSKISLSSSPPSPGFPGRQEKELASAGQLVLETNF